MSTRNHWKEMLLSLAASQSMVPFGDNRGVLRKLSSQIWTLRATEASGVEGLTAQLPSRWSGRAAKRACRS